VKMYLFKCNHIEDGGDVKIILSSN